MFYLLLETTEVVFAIYDNFYWVKKFSDKIYYCVPQLFKHFNSSQAMVK